MDIAVDGPDFTHIDEIEETLLRAAPNRFRRALTPSNLNKVHYQADDGLLVRLDIYNIEMHSLGEGTFQGFPILSSTQPQEFPNIPPFECKVMCLEHLIDMKLVAFLERGNHRDLQDISFGLFMARLTPSPGFAWYAKNIKCFALGVSGEIEACVRSFGDLSLPLEATETYAANLELLRSFETGVRTK